MFAMKDGIKRAPAWLGSTTTDATRVARAVKALAAVDGVTIVFLDDLDAIHALPVSSADDVDADGIVGTYAEDASIEDIADDLRAAILSRQVRIGMLVGDATGPRRSHRLRA